MYLNIMEGRRGNLVATVGTAHPTLLNAVKNLAF